ncbi:hypothetical protein [Aquipuribacter nitratireducens]|uniref:Uncharacterized protein n=1 Tax=Aquipuribacter nitratireducens TaxID=650104 RepID=A0ABW0GQW8_9MICO
MRDPASSTGPQRSGAVTVLSDRLLSIDAAPLGPPRRAFRSERHNRRRLRDAPGMTAPWQADDLSALDRDESKRLVLRRASQWVLEIGSSIRLRTLDSVLWNRSAY